MEERFIVGLMSGTSVDGIDAALTRVRGSGKDTQIEVLAFDTLAYSKDIRNKIFLAMDPDKSNTPLICSLNFELGYCFAEAVKNVCRKANFELAKLDAIGSHGQTIYHQPLNNNNYVASTLQIGEPAVIAYEIKTPVVSNFRVMDMAAGGQGAPLVPYVDFLLFGQSDRSVTLQNIGGISNVTAIPKKATLEDVFAFDTGPGNMVIDALAKKFYDMDFDPNGQWAKAGQVCESLLNEWMTDPYIHERPPKTTGREKYGKAFVDTVLQKWGDLPPNDLIATATRFTAQSIAQNYQHFILSKVKIEEMIISGGGVHNQTLMAWLRFLMPGITIKTSDDYGLSSDAKEAVAFAVLANEMMSGHPANVPGATGAKKGVVLGNWTPFRTKD